MPEGSRSAFFGFFASYRCHQTQQIKDRVQMQRNARLTRLVFSSILAGSAFLLQYLNFPIPLFPGFLQMDFSKIPVLLGGFSPRTVT
jgi:hypothetical protein